MRKRLLLLTGVCSVLFAMEAWAGQLVSDETGLRYMNDDGTVKVGWHQEGVDGPWYYFGEDGYAVKEWFKENNRLYYFRSENGQMIKDRITSFGTPMAYQFEDSGACTAMWDYYDGWLEDDRGWYYRNYSQSYAVGWKRIDGEWYYFDEEGYN